MPESYGALKLYHFPGACSRVTVTALIKLGLEYESEIIDITKGEQKSPAYLAVNPDGKVPAMLVGQEVLTQNASILLFLHHLYPTGGLLPQVSGLVEEAQQVSDLIWVASTVHPMVRQVRAPHRFTTGDTAGVEADGRAKISGLLDLLEERFDSGDWWYEAEWSIIDVYLHWCLSTAVSAGLDIQRYSNVSSHFESVLALPEYEEALVREASTPR
ncbi:MAG: glutathione S-transferase family protein [Pseudomonadota bacterium]